MESVVFSGTSRRSGFAEGRVCFQDNNMELERDHIRKDSKEQVGDFIFQLTVGDSLIVFDL